jgi:hypothetical protein
MLSSPASVLLLVSMFGIAWVGTYLYFRMYSPQMRGKRRREWWMRGTMGTVFVMLAILKLVNVEGFVERFVQYDFVGEAFRPYATMYPFIELLFAAGLFFGQRAKHLKLLYGAIIVVMVVGLAGVVRVVGASTPLQCGCTGTVFALPVSYISASEGILMLSMASLLLHGQLAKKVRFQLPEHATARA